MRQTLFLTALAVGFGIIAVAQDNAEFQTWMKTMNPSVRAIRSAADSAAAASEATKLADTFDKMATFWKGRNAPDAVEASEISRDAAKAIAAGTGDKADNLQKIQAQCGACHKTHREGAAPDFKIK